MMKIQSRASVLLHKVATFAVLSLLMLLPGIAFAQATDQPLPYEAGLSNLVRSLNGPVPFAISLVGIVACGAMLIFGGEISGFMRTLVFIVLVVAIIVQATSIIDMLGGDWNGTAPGAGGSRNSSLSTHLVPAHSAV